MIVKINKQNGDMIETQYIQINSFENFEYKGEKDIVFQDLDENTYEITEYEYICESVSDNYISAEILTDLGCKLESITWKKSEE